MNESTPHGTPAAPAGRAGPALKAVGYLGALGVALALIWHWYGRKIWKDYQSWRAEYRASEDSVPIGYVGINYRRSYNDRAPEFHFAKDGKKTLWAAKGDAGRPPEFYDVTDAAFPVQEVEGGFGRDSIPGIDFPILEPPDGEHARNLRSRQMVFGLALGEGPRAYPEDLIGKIEVVNDRDGSTPFVVVYDRGHQSAFGFDRTVSGDAVTFGTTGYSVRKSPLLYDRKTKSLWLISGDEFRCINGAFKGTILHRFRVAEHASWEEWRSRHPNTSIVVGNDRSKPIPDE
jgi:hypothetical protein